MDTETRIKFCGITSWTDAKAAVDAGADMLGFVCDENSPRLIEPETFWQIATRLPPEITRVGVFNRRTAPAWKQADPALLQRFHTIQYADDSVWSETVRANWDMDRKIKAFTLQRDADLRKIAGYNGLVRSFLLNVHTAAPDGYLNPDAYGWELVREVKQFGKRIYLAGGLTAETVQAAIARVRPYAVDVTVGIESEPGIKDPAKMRAFVRAVRESR